MTGFRPASKKNARGRVAIAGPPGSGKTMSALRMAAGLANGGSIGVIDTERGSSEKYADKFAFNVLVLESFDIASYLRAIDMAAKAGIDVLVIDSLSHAWEWLLEHVDKLKATKYRGNDFRAWGEATPLQNSLVNAILRYPGHIIVTLRTKTEWAMERDDKTGKVSPVRVGLAPKQREGIEYEFDLVMTVAANHFATITKSRLGEGQDEIIDRPDEEWGRKLLTWLTGPDAPDRSDEALAKFADEQKAEEPMPPMRIAAMHKSITDLGIPAEQFTDFTVAALRLAKFPVEGFSTDMLTESQARAVHRAAKAVSEGKMEWTDTPDGLSLLDLEGVMNA